MSIHFNLIFLHMSILFSNFAVGKGGNSPTSTTNIQTSCTMNKIILIGQYPQDMASVRTEIDNLNRESMGCYHLWSMALMDKYAQINIEGAEDYISYTTLLLEADSFISYLEQWCDFRTTSISIQ